MDKQKVLNLLKDADCFLKDMEASFPKARNRVNSIGWALKSIREEVSKVEAPATAVVQVVQAPVGEATVKV